MNFSKTVFQKDMYKFSKRDGMYKRFFNDFQMFQSLCTKEYFLMICSNVYSKSMYRDFSIYIFYVHSKGFFNNFFYLKCICTKNLKDFKNMYKIQSENMYKSVFFFLSQNFNVESEVLGNH